MKRLFTIAAALGLLVGSGPASAFILDAGVTKNAGKWRGDEQKQSNKFTDAVIKNLLKCEKAADKNLGVQSAQLSCFATCDTALPNGGGGTACFDPLGVVSGTPCTDDSDCAGGGNARCLPDPLPCSLDATAAADFASALDDAAAKFDPAKKAFDADGDGDIGDLDDIRSIGCIADCSGDDGTQLDAAACGGLTGGDILPAWQASLTSEDGTVRETLDLFDFQFNLVCGAQPDPNDCVQDQGKTLAKMTSCVNKAAQKCENKAGVGTDDSTVCDDTEPGVAACVSAAIPNLLPGAAALVPTVVGGLLNAVNGAYNRQVGFDTGGSPGVVGPGAPSCGTCGDGTIDFGEECDPAAPLPGGCASCPSTSNFLLSQSACQCF